MSGLLNGSRPARLDSVAKFICESGHWRVTNLQIQKLLYLAQMVYMGQTGGRRLADAAFEAWDFGPVEPSLYRKVRMFGAGPIEDVFFDARPFKDDDERLPVLKDICRDLLRARPGDLVAITHWPEGAWAKNYVPGVRGIPITDADIIDEYRKRVTAGHIKPD